jgi:hypothetical protein
MALFHARAFGLTLASDGPLPGLRQSPSAAPDIRIHLRGFPDWLRSGNAGESEIWSSRDDATTPDDTVSVRSVGAGRAMLVTYADGMEFLVSRQGDEVWVRGPGGFTMETAATYLLGPVVGLVLRLRGITCLHASAVSVDGKALVFVGEAGAGKSTIAAAFALRGHHVLTDDIAALSLHRGAWQVEPGIPSVRLWDDSTALLLGDPSALPHMAPGWEKRYMDLSAHGAGSFPLDAVPLVGVYVLDRGGTSPPGAEPRRLSPGRALITLVRHTYANVLLDRDLRAAEFRALSSVVSTVPVWRVAAPTSRAALDDFCERRTQEAAA